jgi:hypothetical protein
MKSEHATPGASPGVSFSRAEATRKGSPTGLPRGGSARRGCLSETQPGAAVVHELGWALSYFAIEWEAKKR